MAARRKYAWRWPNCNFHDLSRNQHAKRLLSLDQKRIHLTAQMEQAVDTKNILLPNSTEPDKY